MDLREVKEVRVGKCSKDFERWTEDARKFENQRCYVVFYGNEFCLKTLSIGALSETECDLWVKGLKYLARDTVSAPYPLQVERWLWKEFCDMASGRNSVSLKDVKAFLPQVNCKMSNQRLKEAFQEVDGRRQDELCHNDFLALYSILIHDDNVIIPFQCSYKVIDWNQSEH